MAKKKKKVLAERQNVTWYRRVFAPFRRFDWAALMLAAVILIVTLIAAGHDYRLDRSDPYGFLMWFLLVLGYLPLETLELFARIFGINGAAIDQFMQGKEAWILGGINLFILLFIWSFLRFYIRRRMGAEPLRIATIFMRLIFCWGVFQLLCFSAVKVWNDGKINPLHRNLQSADKLPNRK